MIEIKLAGESTRPPRRMDRVPIDVDPDVRDALNWLLHRPEMFRVGFSEFIGRAVMLAAEEIREMRVSEGRHPLDGE